MKIVRPFIVASLLLVFATSGFAQYVTEKHTSGGYEYSEVTNDPFHARIYTLKNGLTVYLSVNKNEPRIQTMIAVRAGSKYDPKDATGLAHYLEHLLFKGTDKFGSLDYSKEKPYLDEIENLYETYRSTKDTSARRAIYHEIDSVSGVAAHYAIANEYDKMVSELGATGTNAFTSDEQTVYVNDIPSNQIEKWLTIEAERFRHPVLRLFHTELEAVYEEKNRGLDNDNALSDEALMAALFPTHPYGQQTTIGTIDHLKNPSIKKIKDFYSKWYVPNNMAVVMAGDFDPDQVIKMIDEKMSEWQPKSLPNWTSPVEVDLKEPAVREVYGPDAEFVQLAWRLPKINTHDADLLTMMDMVLANGTAGLIDLDLNQKQKVLSASSYAESLNDYSAHVLTGHPKEGQSLDEVRDLLLAEVEKVKKGDFDAALLPATINNFTIGRIERAESNGSRAYTMMDDYIHHTDWAQDVGRIETLSKITKQDIVDFANKYYGNNYAIVYKRSGDHRGIEKVTKPAITPVETNRTSQSAFLKMISAMPTPPEKPHFLDFKKDITEVKLTSGIPVYYLHNNENQRFTLYYVIEMGRRNDKKLKYALEYLNYLGTDKMKPEEIKMRFFSLGSSFNVHADDDEVWVSLSGLQKNFKPSVELFETLLASATPNDEALQNYIGRTIKRREDMKKNKVTILRAGLENYAMYGPINPQTYDLTNNELQHLSSAELIDRIHTLTSYQHHVMYYGPAEAKSLVASLDQLHHFPSSGRIAPKPVEFVHQPTNKNRVLFVNYDMAQAEVVMMSKGMEHYEPSMAPVVRLFNEYYGGSMASITFQTIRESKALAYAVWSSYQAGSKKEDPYTIFAYVGSQADKSPETMKSMFELMNDMPRADKLFDQSKEALRNTLSTERTTREGILFAYERAKKMGLDHDINQDIYNQVPKLKFEDIEAFQKQNIKGHNYTIAVLGSKDKVDMKDLAKYGDVEQLSLDQIFGY